MNNQKQEEIDVQDVDLAKVKKWLKDDLSRAMSCLNAIYSDPDLLDSVAVFMHGRMQNHLLKKQQQINFED